MDQTDQLLHRRVNVILAIPGDSGAYSSLRIWSLFKCTYSGFHFISSYSDFSRTIFISSYSYLLVRTNTIFTIHRYVAGLDLPGLEKERVIKKNSYLF